jgi:hypothetical protein
MLLQLNVVLLQLGRVLLLLAGDHLQMLRRRRRLQQGNENQQQKKGNRFREKLPGSSIGRYAPLMGARIKFTKEECARDMGQRLKDATATDAQIELKREEYARDMGQR